jgi:hypothetical protein
MQHIIIMPPHIIIIGMAFIMAIIFVQHSMNISLDIPSIGIMVQVMPSGVISQVIRPIIIGIGIICMGIMPGIPIGIIPIGIWAGIAIGIIGMVALISALLVSAAPWSLWARLCVQAAAAATAHCRVGSFSSKGLDAHPASAEKQPRWRHRHPS